MAYGVGPVWLGSGTGPLSSLPGDPPFGSGTWKGCLSGGQGPEDTSSVSGSWGGAGVGATTPKPCCLLVSRHERRWRDKAAEAAPRPSPVWALDGWPHPGIGGWEGTFRACHPPRPTPPQGPRATVTNLEALLRASCSTTSTVQM